MHCNLRPPEPHQPFPALITTPCQVWSRWTHALPYIAFLLRMHYDLALFRRAILGMRGPFTKLGEYIGWSFLHNNFVSAFWYLAAFSNASGSKSSDVENDTKCGTFWPPPPVKIRREVSEIYIPIVEALPTTEPPEYIWSTARQLSTVDW